MTRTGPSPTSLNTHSFSTDRLDIALPDPSDAAPLFDLVGGPNRREVCAHLLWDGPDTVDDMVGWLGRCRTETFGELGYHWVIRDRTGEVTGEQGRQLGSIGTRPRGEAGRADVGYWLGLPYWGQGLMGEALDGLLRLGFAELDYYKIEAEVFTHNERGLRLVESAGLTREGTVRQKHRKYGVLVDVAVYGILHDEWRP